MQNALSPFSTFVPILVLRKCFNYMYVITLRSQHQLRFLHRRISRPHPAGLQ